MQATPEDTATGKAAMGMDHVVGWRWVQTVDEAIASAKDAVGARLRCERLGCISFSPYVWCARHSALFSFSRSHTSILSPRLLATCVPSPLGLDLLR